MYDYNTTAKRGYAWLKENHPDRIGLLDPDTLDVQVQENCPLGQTGLDWGEYRNWYGKEWIVAHGFDVSPSVEYWLAYELLTDAWRDVLESHRG